MLTALLTAAAVQAAVSQVTIFSDRARVVRTADVEVAGRTRAELPLLPDSVDPSTIRLEATGAEVQKLDIQHVEPDEFPLGEARDLLGKLEKLDDQLRLIADQEVELTQHLAAIRRIAPAVKDEPLRAPPRLNPAPFGETLNFVQDQEKALRARLRELAATAEELRRDRQLQADRARIIGGAGRRSGWRVTAQLDGQGTAHLTLTYLAAQARWAPGYDLQLLKDQKTVKVSFSGAASQETGEDWDSAAMTLSTAIPATVRSLPEISTWKIGEKERFIPTPSRADRPPPRPPPPWVPPPPQPKGAADQLRQELLSRAESAQPATPLEAEEEKAEDLPSAAAELSAAQPKEALPFPGMPPAPAAAPPPPTRESRRRQPSMTAKAEPAVAKAARPQAQPMDQVGIAPPPSWQRPTLPPGSPAELAGGYDLEFASVRRETVRSGKGARRVLLFSESWPVTTERLLFPALSPDAYLVAQIRNPSNRTLPSGQATLSVGADPAGSATVPLVAAGQEFTLPLGVDKALRSFRNVAQVQSEKGLFSKDEVTRYVVTIEVQNPYPAQVPLHIVDQLPLEGDKNIEVQLVDGHGAEREEGTGKLTWRVNAPASGKVTLAFTYQLKRPKGYRVHQ